MSLCNLNHTNPTFAPYPKHYFKLHPILDLVVRAYVVNLSGVNLGKSRIQKRGHFEEVLCKGGSSLSFKQSLGQFLSGTRR